MSESSPGTSGKDPHEKREPGWPGRCFHPTRPSPSPSERFIRAEASSSSSLSDGEDPEKGVKIPENPKDAGATLSRTGRRRSRGMWAGTTERWEICLGWGDWERLETGKSNRMEPSLGPDSSAPDSRREDRSRGSPVRGGPA